MERVMFLVEDSNEHICCLLNPDSFQVRRSAGIQPRRTANGMLSGNKLSDQPLLYTGGGSTEITLDLLFDLSVAGSTATSDDVRDLTAPLALLAENAADRDEPPRVRFIWGKSWNIPGVITALAERLESFTPGGAPRRSWLRLRMLRVDDAAAEGVDEASDIEPGALGDFPLPEDFGGEDSIVHELLGDGDGSGERLDQLADRYYGDPAYWRLLAGCNDIDDPGRLSAGTALYCPSRASVDAQARISHAASRLYVGNAGFTLVSGGKAPRAPGMAEANA